MIVVCTGCSAKFKVADEKVGPRGAKLRCSRCQTVFTVRREDAPPEAPPAPPPAPGLSGLPPLPRRGAAPPPRSPDLGAQVDARAAFEIDLEHPAAAPRAAEPDPFAPAPFDDPFAPAAAAAPAPPEAGLEAPGDPFGGGAADDDPFAAVQAPVPPELLRAPPPAPPPEPGLADDPFSSALPPLAGVSADGDLALEERTTPPPRPAMPQTSAPLDDPFGGLEGGGEPGLGGGHPSDIPPMASDLPGEPFGGFGGAAPEAPAAAPEGRREAPLRVDPFAAAAVDAEPLQVAAEPGRAAARSAVAAAPAGAAADEDAAAEAAMEPAAARAVSRLRGAAVNAVSLLALLVLAVAILLVWRGDVPLSEAVHPARLVAALTHADRAPQPLETRGVTSGLYDRVRGAPLLFVRGEVRSNAGAPLGGVRVAVELVKDGTVLARAEGQAGGVPTPEELYGAADAAALARVAEAAGARAPAAVAPGQALPFLVALADYPADLSGVSLRVRAEGGAAR